METKLSKLKKMIEAGKWENAICFAAKFPQLGDQSNAIRTAADCIKHPSFYIQLKKDIPAAIEAGKAALVERYKIQI